MRRTGDPVVAKSQCGFESRLPPPLRVCDYPSAVGVSPAGDQITAAPRPAGTHRRRAIVCTLRESAPAVGTSLGDATLTECTLDQPPGWCSQQAHLICPRARAFVNPLSPPNRVPSAPSPLRRGLGWHAVLTHSRFLPQRWTSRAATHHSPPPNLLRLATYIIVIVTALNTANSQHHGVVQVYRYVFLDCRHPLAS